MTRALVLLLALLVSLPSVVRGQAVTLAGPTNVSAEDVPDDIGGQVMVKWSLSPDDKLLPDGTRAINGYAIYRKVVPNAMALESGAETAAGTGALGFADERARRRWHAAHHHSWRPRASSSAASTRCQCTCTREQ